MTAITRVAGIAEIRDVARLAREIWTDHYTPIIGSAQVEYMLRKFQSEKAITVQLSSGYEYYLASVDGQAAGYLALVPDYEESSLMLSKIYVCKDLRGRGVGGSLLEFCETVCRDRKLGSLWLTVNRHNSGSIRWYEQMGFRCEGSLVQDIGNGFVMDDFKMVKRLPEIS